MKKKTETKNERLKKIIEHLIDKRVLKNKSDAAFQLGYKSLPRFSDVLNGKMNVTDRLCLLLSEKFPYVNTPWLMTGNGEMLKNVNGGSEKTTFNADQERSAEQSVDWKSMFLNQQAVVLSQQTVIKNLSDTIKKLQKDLDNGQSRRGLMGKGKIVSKMNSVA